MRFDQPIKSGADVTIEYDDIQWDESVIPETFDRTGRRTALSGRVEKVIAPHRSVDEHFRVATEHGEYMVFANGDVFALPTGCGADELIGIDAAVTARARRKMRA